MRKSLIVAALFSVVAVLSPARAVVAVAVAAPGASTAGFTTPVVVAPVGGPLTFVNSDPAPHNVVANGVFGSDRKEWCGGYPKGKCPIFWSATIGIGQTPVLGLDQVKSGTSYPFFCTVHPNMKGTLVAV